MLILVATLTLMSCKSTTSSLSQRVLTLEDTKLVSGKPYFYTSWKCKDYVRGGKVIVETGLIDRINPNSEQNIVGTKDTLIGKGFVLLDDKNDGFFSEHSMDGINHRWDWEGESGNNYGIRIHPDGTGYYFDFGSSSILDMFFRKSVTSTQTFMCSKQ